MNCLKVDISLVSAGPDVVVKEENNISLFVDIVKKEICRCINLLFNCMNDISMKAETVNDSSRIMVDAIYPEIGLDIGLVCKANTGIEYYLQVLDGYLLTVDGCYVKVMKS